MHRVPNDGPAALRARWLAELAEALETARALVSDLEARDERIDAADLSAQIEAVRSEVLAMRVKRSTAGGYEFGPEWSEILPWTRSA